MKANSEERVKAVLEVFEQKLIKRGISLRSLDAGEPFPSGKEYRIEATLKNGISSEDAKKISKIIRDEAPEERSRARSRATSCACSPRAATTCRPTMALLKGKDLDVALQFVNFR